MEKIIMYAKKTAKKVPSRISRDVPTTPGDVDRALLIIRLGLGYFFIYHGLGYFFGFDPVGGIATFSGLLAFTGFPVPTFFAYLVAFVELFGGIAILLGFFTRAFGVLLSVIAIVAFTTVHGFAPGLNHGDVDILALVAALALLFAGPGKYSLAERWYREDLARPAKETKEESVVVKEKDTDAKKLEKKEEKKEEKKNEEKQATVFPVDQKAELKHEKGSSEPKDHGKKEEKSKDDDDALEDIYRSLMIDDSERK